MASDYTDGLAIKAIELIFKYLPRSYDNPNDDEAREKMHNASCIAGMAFSNAFLGINHSCAHKLGSVYHIPHGRAIAVLLPHVIRYNAQKPTKFTIFPKYGEFAADKRYAQISRQLDLGGNNRRKIENLKRLLKPYDETNMEKSIKESALTRRISSINSLNVRGGLHDSAPRKSEYPLFQN
jgi:acetaldehyde dehydrogenase/alcohol dehydrogenase